MMGLNSMVNDDHIHLRLPKSLKKKFAKRCKDKEDRKPNDVLRRFIEQYAGKGSTREMDV